MWIAFSRILKRAKYKASFRCTLDSDNAEQCAFAGKRDFGDGPLRTAISVVTTYRVFNQLLKKVQPTSLTEDEATKDNRYNLLEGFGTGVGVEIEKLRRESTDAANSKQTQEERTVDRMDCRDNTVAIRDCQTSNGKTLGTAVQKIAVGQIGGTQLLPDCHSDRFELSAEDTAAVPIAVLGDYNRGAKQKVALSLKNHNGYEGVTTQKSTFKFKAEGSRHLNSNRSLGEYDTKEDASIVRESFKTCHLAALKLNNVVYESKMKTLWADAEKRKGNKARMAPIVNYITKFSREASTSPNMPNFIHDCIGTDIYTKYFI